MCTLSNRIFARSHSLINETNYHVSLTRSKIEKKIDNKIDKIISITFYRTINNNIFNPRNKNNSTYLIIDQQLTKFHPPGNIGKSTNWKSIPCFVWIQSKTDWLLQKTFSQFPWLETISFLSLLPPRSPGSQQQHASVRKSRGTGEIYQISVS